MFKKMLPWLIIFLVVITLITVAAFILLGTIMNDPEPTDPTQKAQDIANTVETRPLTATERAELSYKIENITTNLADINYVVRISFSFVLEHKAAKEEMEMIQPLIQDIIGNILADTEPSDLNGSGGRDALKAKIMNQLNTVLKEGKLLEIDISDLILTQR